MLQLAVSMARHRISALLAVAFAVLGGAAMVAGTGILAESGLRSHLPPGRVGAADIVVSANQTVQVPGDVSIALPERATVPADLAGRLAAVPGVTAAVTDISFPAALVDGQGQVVPGEDPGAAGHGWSSTRLLDSAPLDGTEPKTSGEVALSATAASAANVKVGDRVRLVVAGRPADYRVVGVVSNASAGIYFADPTAARLAGRDQGAKAGTVDLIGLQTAPGAAESVAKAVRAELNDSGLSVSTGDDRGDSAAPGGVASRELLVLLAGSLSGIILLIIGFVIAGALAVSISGQRRELALLRAVGATPRQVRRLVTTQATVIAAAALVPGVALGYFLAALFRNKLVDLELLPAGLPLTFSPLPALAAVLLMLGVVQLSALGAAWRASKMPATEAVAESRVEPRKPSKLRTPAGLLLIIAALTLSVMPVVSRTQIGAGMTSIAGIVAAIGLALAGPELVRRASGALVRRLPAGISAPSWLAVSNVNGYATRFAGAVTNLAMAVVFILTYTLSQTTVLTASSDDVTAGTLAEQTIGAPALGGLPPDVLRKVAATPGVQAAAPVTNTTVLWPFRELGEETVEETSAMVLTPAAQGVLDLDVRSGSLAGLTGNTVAVGSDVAKSRGAEVGSKVNLRLGDGSPVEATVAAVYDRSLGFGPVVISRDLAAGHTSTGLDQSILVRTDGTEAAQRNLAALVAAQPGLTLASAAVEPTGLSDAPPEVWINLAVILVLLGYLLLSIANKLVAGTNQRRAEIATLRLNGTTPQQIRTMMRREAALLFGAALATGLVLSAVPLALLGIGFLERPWPSGPLWLLPAITVIVGCIAFLTSELPTRQALRTAPADALSHQE